MARLEVCRVCASALQHARKTQAKVRCAESAELGTVVLGHLTPCDGSVADRDIHEMDERSGLAIWPGQGEIYLTITEGRRSIHIR